MKYALLLLLLLAAYTVQAQKGNTTFSVSYGGGNGQRKPLLAKAELLGSSSEGPIRAFDVGAYRMIGKHVSLETGISLLNHKFKYTLWDQPGRIPITRSVNTLILPIKLRVDILKYLFISTGVLLNTDLGEHDEVDIGFGIGAGVQYYFKNKYGIFIYPQTNLHTITIGLKESHTAFGLAYRIPYPNPPYKN